MTNGHLNYTRISTTLTDTTTHSGHANPEHAVAMWLLDFLSAAVCARKFLKSGAGEGIRTLDPNLGKVVLYP